METAPLKVFISYAHWDRETCEKIAGILKRDNRFDVWYDAGLVPGEVYRNKIGDLYFYGKGCPVDYKTAVACYQKGEQAPDGGHAHALRRAKKALGQCYENGLGVEQDYETAAAKYLESYLYGEEACFEAYERCIKKTAELK